MPAPEIGQARAQQSASNREVSPEIQLQDGQPALTAAGDSANSSVVGQETEESPTTMSLDELPDEHLVMLAASQSVAVADGADRESLLAALRAAGITRVQRPS